MRLVGTWDHLSKYMNLWVKKYELLEEVYYGIDIPGSEETTSKAAFSQPKMRWLNQLTGPYRKIKCSLSETKVQAETPAMNCPRRDMISQKRESAHDLRG